MAAAANIEAMRMVERAFEALRSPGPDKLPILARLLADFNYDPLLQPIDTANWPERAKDCIALEAPAQPQIVSQAGQGGGFKVIYCPLRPGLTRTARLRLTDQRAIAQQVLREERFPDCLLVFSDPEQRYWHFVNPRLVTAREQQTEGRRQRYVLRRISVSPEDKLRTAIERFSQISLADLDPYTLSAPEIHHRHDRAFDVEQVTEVFFQGFKEHFKELQDTLCRQTGDFQWAHDYALRLLSRIMFVYFIQRKRWLGDEPDFMVHYWQTYLDNRGRKRARFFDEWLHPLFFEAFASPAESSLVTKREYMPPEIRDTLRNAPYLNGGLFSRDDLDHKHSGHYSIPDSYFEGLLDPREGFFERYNFTISEDSPLDQEVAVDPEMIGRVYETLVNISESGADAAENREKQREAGIFYTPRTEIDLMCRLALSDYLRHHLGDEHRDLIYQLIFAFDPDEKHEADDAAAAQDLWPRLDELIRDVTVVDPACGSGSFLVGMMNILADLRTRANGQVGRAQTDYDIKREIIRQNLYGVDVMQWAVEIAELRLWLQLVIHTELDPAELQGPLPLLPNLTFKIRQGDSLVQEIGGVNIAHLKADVDIPKSIKGRLRQLNARKLRFYDAKLTEAQAAEEQAAIQKHERQLFLDILDAKARALEQRIRDIEGRLSVGQRTLTGEAESALPEPEQQRLEAEREELQAQLKRLQEARETVLRAKQVPFVWDMAFVEIFSGDEQGFDIVIGNPPYVRQEKIADPTRPHSEQSADDRKEYKAKLARSVYLAFPEYFGDNPDKPKHKLSGRSDLYVYFYFHALSLLNPQGAFCFITSNSWLDVDYGTALQEFLARQVPIHMILDNQVKRSFAQADVNTIIALFGAPLSETDAAVDNIARFVMVQVPFEQILHPVIFEEIDEAEERRTLPEYRVFPIPQRDILEAGMTRIKEEKKPRPRRAEGPLILVGKYEGDKWGGKYLRAPDIYWEILEAAGDRLVPLGEIAEVRRGFTTGANDFFYLRPTGETARRGLIHVRNPDGWEGTIEGRYLRPVAKGPGDFSSIRAREADLETLAFCCRENPSALRGTHALRYIRWGERQGIDQRVTCRGRQYWFWLPEQAPPPIIAIKGIWERHFVVANEPEALVDQQLYAVYPLEGVWCNVILAACNTSFWAIQMELTGRANFGEGILWLATYEVARGLVPDPRRLSQAEVKRLARALGEVRDREVPRAHEDNIFVETTDVELLRVAGLRPHRAAELGRALRELVDTRREKAGST